MLALRLPPEIEARLDALAKKTGRTKSYYARQAILEHLEDLEDYFVAEERIRTASGDTVSLDDVMAELGDDAGNRPMERPLRSARAQGAARPRKQ
jgi:RHH-type rel operon transcriptional repressor/antitoxin RelB